MKHLIYDFTKLATSLLVFVVISMALGGLSYQFFASDGSLFLWIKHVGSENPLLLLVLGGMLTMVKRWMEGYERNAIIADIMFYLAILLGIYFVFNYMLATG